MRLAPLLIAVLVAVGLYAIVFERDRVLGFAREQDEPTGIASDSGASSDENAAPPSRKVSVVAIESTASGVDNAVLLRGQTEAARKVEIRAETSGLVASAPLPKGSFVESGQVLCQIDPGTRPSKLAEAEARMAEARITDTAADRLAKGGFGSETSAAAAKASLQAAQAAVDLAKKDIERLTLLAPFKGLLDSETAELGSLMQQGSLCATIIQLDPIKVVGFLPELSVGKVAIGAPAKMQLGNGRDITGQVTFISRSADPATRTFRVEVETANPDLTISDGQTADLAIAAAGVSAHLVPASALTLDDHGTMGVRIVDDTDHVRFKPVAVVRDTIDGVLLSGLPETARIIVVGQEYVSDGAAVTVTLRGGDE
ncbi:efflux RND transporter periplasmic adaptor subunit [Pseudoruegeria sp. SK021]|uniref:efflux RND transporter periplasmic adaptor subunit n=1 Tax=Pseudoruegeria sp. SK021 TaxID=1933035 RepID=UPI000A2298A0|nr:efflux RND transporter periplasmic adaptor subunit [Pseudoruegeria sp. SK021]OSP56285.1 efflux transporter periplasmic adaptor subunit [Pseudoruegeria sp. SK021]